MTVIRSKRRGEVVVLHKLRPNGQTVASPQHGLNLVNLSMSYSPSLNSRFFFFFSFFYQACEYDFTLILFYFIIHEFIPLFRNIEAKGMNKSMVVEEKRQPVCVFF